MKYYSIVLPMSTATLPIDQLSVVTKTYSWCHTWGCWLRNQIAKKMWQIMEGHYFTNPWAQLARFVGVLLAMIRGILKS